MINKIGTCIPIYDDTSGFWGEVSPGLLFRWCSWLQTVSKFEDKIKCKVFEKLNHKSKGIVGTHVKKMNITALHLEIQDKSVDADRQS